MEKRLKKHWTEFDRMVRRLGALRVECDGFLRAGGPMSSSHVAQTFGEAVTAVCRFGGTGRMPDGGSADQVWEALERASDAARRAQAALVPGDLETSPDQ